MNIHLERESFDKVVWEERIDCMCSSNKSRRKMLSHEKFGKNYSFCLILRFSTKISEKQGVFQWKTNVVHWSEVETLSEWHLRVGFRMVERKRWGDRTLRCVPKWGLIFCPMIQKIFCVNVIWIFQFMFYIQFVTESLSDWCLN